MFYEYINIICFLNNSLYNKINKHAKKLDKLNVIKWNSCLIILSLDQKRF